MSNQEAQENGNGGTPESATEFNMNFIPETEDELIGLAKWFKSREHQSGIKLHRILGKRINEAGETVYGQNTAGRIASEVGYSKSTVHKSRRFAREYTDEQVALLLNGPFSLSWRDITQNQSVPPEDFVRTYRESRNPEQFRNTVTQFKRTRSRRSQTTREPRKTRTELETENTELRNRVSELEAENSKLQAHIQALNEKLEVPEEQQIDLAELIKPADELPN